MRKFPLDSKSVYLITDRLTRKYLCEEDVAEGYLLVSSKEYLCFTDARYYQAAKVTLDKVGVKCSLFKSIQDIKNYLKDFKDCTLFLDYSRVTVKEFNEYKTFGLDIADCEDHLAKLKSVKDESELSFIRRACAVAQKAYHTAIKTVREGMTELELKDKIESLMVEYGALGAAFETIVAFGANGAVPHHVTGNTTLKKDTSILVDMGANVNGYFSDLTRTAFFGTPPLKFVRCYQAVKKANELAEEKIVAKMTSDKADEIARSYLKDQGLDEYFTHSLGHGVGTEIHEYPTLSPRKSEELKENMTFTIEPGVYLNGEFGIRIEDTVVIKNGRVERLFNDDKNLIIL